MAETCEITLKHLPSRKMRKQVRKFLKGRDVELKDISGQVYKIDLKRNRLIISPDVDMSVQNVDGSCTVVDIIR